MILDLSVGLPYVKIKAGVHVCMFRTEIRIISRFEQNFVHEPPDRRNLKATFGPIDYLHEVVSIMLQL